MADAELRLLEQRLGRLHAWQRLGVEKDHEAQVFGQGLNFFHIENSAVSALHSPVRADFQHTVLHGRASLTAV
jgi:uncharacterized protein